MDAFRMIEAPSGISGSAFCTVNRRPFTLRSKIESKCSSVRETKPAVPAFAKTISSLPFSRLICTKRRSRSPRFDASLRTPLTFPPISFTAAASSGSRRPVMKTYAPSFTNAFAVARPMPLLPPVMSAIFPSRLPMSFSLAVLSHFHRSPPRRTNARPWPGDRAEPRAARDRSRVHQPERRKGHAERDEDVRHVATPSQSQPAPAGRDRKPRPVREQWPGEPPGALRCEVQRQTESEEPVERTHDVQIA